ncbi:MAG: PilZ domain-containing protein [Methylovirgula sp.]
MDLNVKPIQKPVERRRHQRVKISLLGRYMLEDRREFPCVTTDMSPGGVACIASVRGAVGERVIIYLDQIGRVEGKIARLTDRGFAVALNMPYAKREKIANQLTWLVNRDILGLPEDRRFERIVPLRRHAILRLNGDAEHVVKLIDVSMSGAAIATALKPSIGALAIIGHTTGKVVRHFDGGFAIAFDQMIEADRFDENIKL